MPVKLTSTFSHNPRYKTTTTNTMYDVGDHSSLPTSAIIVLACWKKEGRKMENFAWATKTLFQISGA